jgi:hypothetical protein
MEPSLRPSPQIVNNDSHDDAGGHHVTSGVTLTGLGVFAILTSILIELLDVELLFIEPQTMGLFSSVFIVVGASMIWQGKASNRGQSQMDT